MSRMYGIQVYHKSSPVKRTMGARTIDYDNKGTPGYVWNVRNVVLCNNCNGVCQVNDPPISMSLDMARFPVAIFL